MRLIGVLIVLVLAIACEEQSQTTKSDLIEGKWKVTHIDGEPIKTHEGLFFAPNKQYFEIDSQGKPVPRLMEKVWKLEEDTLKLVDFNWEPEFIDKKGTFYYLLEELSSDRMTLILIKRKESKKISYKKLNK